ncbi:MAG: MarR family winged helix-turn-helix transcriptional regulator [Desulfovibrionaceae bacterium]|jgi:DNA-binding MarR family transcriptional regulator
MDKAFGYDMDNAIGYLIGHTAMRIKIGLRRLFVQSDLDVTPEQWVVLFRLYEREGLTQSELGDRTVKDKTTVTRILDRLEKKGLLYRRRDTRDRRSQRIYLTESGTTVLGALMPLVHDYGAALFDDMRPEDRDTLRRLLGLVETRLDSLLDPKDAS